MVGSLDALLLNALCYKILFLYHAGSNAICDALEGIAGFFKVCKLAASHLETRLLHVGKMLQG